MHFPAHVTATCSSRPITAGDWSVLKEPGLFVDEKRKHVYFVANKYHPSDANLYVSNWICISDK